MPHTHPDTWEEHQKWELEWHKHNNNCANSYNEETKQYGYAHLMGLDEYLVNYYGIKSWDFGDKTVLDVGGGPYSMLLKAKARKMVVVDPCDYPNWVSVRYSECNVDYKKNKGEEMEFDEVFDLVLLYNVLQHVEVPEEIIKRMKKYGKTIYFFDWIDTSPAPGHPHTLTEEKLNKWLGGYGKVQQLSSDGLYGKAYFGVFQGDHYGK